MDKSSSCSLSLRWVAPDEIPYEPQDTFGFLYHGRDHDHQPKNSDGSNTVGTSKTSDENKGSSLPHISSEESKDSGQPHVDLVCRRLTMKWEPMCNITHRYLACRCVIRRSSPSRLEPEIDVLRYAICPRHNSKGISFKDYGDYEKNWDDPYFHKFGGYDAFRAFIHLCFTPMYNNLGNERFLAQKEFESAYDCLETASEELGESLSKVHQEYIFEHDDMLIRLGFTGSDKAKTYITAERKKRGLGKVLNISDSQFKHIKESPVEKEVEMILNGKWRGKRHWLPDC